MSKFTITNYSLIFLILLTKELELVGISLKKITCTSNPLKLDSLVLYLKFRLKFSEYFNSNFSYSTNESSFGGFEEHEISFREIPTNSSSLRELKISN